MHLFVMPFMKEYKEPYRRKYSKDPKSLRPLGNGDVMVASVLIQLSSAKGQLRLQEAHAWHSTAILLSYSGVDSDGEAGTHTHVHSYTWHRHEHGLWCCGDKLLACLQGSLVVLRQPQACMLLHFLPGFQLPQSWVSPIQWLRDRHQFLQQVMGIFKDGD